MYREPVGDRAPQGWYMDQRAPELHVPPTPAPMGLPGPASLYMYLSPSSVLGTGYTHPITHPVYPPVYPSQPVHRTARDGRSGVRGGRNSRFDPVVGEPRGVEHRHESKGPAGTRTHGA